jgi:FtsX-like permease family protein
MRLVLSRAAAARALLLAAALAATVTTVLLSGFVLYARLLPVAAVRAALLDAPAADRTLLLTSGAPDTADELAARDAAVRELFAGGLAGEPLAVSAAGYTSAHQLPGGEYAVVGFLTELPEHARLVEGAWPAPGPDGEAVQAVVPAAVAGQLGIAVGDRVALSNAVVVDQPAPLQVVGLWEPLAAADPYWRLFATPVEGGGRGPFLVHRDDFLGRYRLASIMEWLAVPDPVRLAEDDLRAVAADTDALAERLTEQAEVDPAMDSSLRISTGLDDLARRLDVATVVNRSGMVLPAALLVVIAGYGLVLVARLLAAHRRGEHALLRARGASRRQLVRLTAAEALLVTAPAAVLGGPLGARLVGLADRQAGDRSLDIAGDLTPYGLLGPPLAWLVAALAAAGCAAALALPAAGRGRTWVAEQQERSRPGRFARIQRAGVDVALVGLAVLGWTQLRRYETAVATSGGGLGIDPLLVAAPVVGVLAATAIALRLLPAVTRWGVRLAARRDTFPGLLGMWQADRRPHAGPVLLLVLAVATAVLAPAVAATWQRSQRDQAAQAVGADLRVTVSNPIESSRASLLAAVPGAAGGMPVHRSGMILPASGQSTLLAVDSAAAPGVALVRPDLAGPELFAGLSEQRPVMAGLSLPAGAVRLVGAGRFVPPEPVSYEMEVPGFDPEETYTIREDLPEIRAADLSVYVADAAGVVSSVRPGERGDPGDRLRTFDVALPAGATALLGLEVTVTTSGWTQLEPPPDPDPVAASWQWRDLRWVDAAGLETPVELPAGWGPSIAGDVAGVPEPGWSAAERLVSLELRPDRDFPASVPLRVTPPIPRLSTIPVVASRDVLEATGTEVGRTLALDQAGSGIQLPALRVAGAVAAVPGTGDGSGLMVDLPWLSLHQFVHGRPPPAVTEWWVATTGCTSTAAVEELPWSAAVYDRRAEQRRLLDNPLGTGVRFSLWAAAAAAALLAAFGLVMDSRSTALRRRRELAVLYTLGTPPPGLARALVLEQAVLAGLGVLAGLVVGVAVAATMGTSLVLTPAGEVPVPEPLLALSPAQFATPALGLFAVALVLGALVARRARRELAGGALRIGED